MNLMYLHIYAVLVIYECIEYLGWSYLDQHVRFE